MIPALELRGFRYKTSITTSMAIQTSEFLAWTLTPVVDLRGFSQGMNQKYEHPVQTSEVLHQRFYTGFRLTPPFSLSIARWSCKETTVASLLSRATRINSPAAARLAIMELPP